MPEPSWRHDQPGFPAGTGAGAGTPGIDRLLGAEAVFISPRVTPDARVLAVGTKTSSLRDGSRYACRAVGAIRAGRATTSISMLVGEEHVYALEATLPPPGASWTREQWIARIGTILRLRIERCKQNWDAWVVTRSRHLKRSSFARL